MTLLFDAGAFVAVERGAREIDALVKAERLAGRAPRTHAGVVGQVWRGGTGRQVSLARLLAGTDIVPVDDRLARRVGVLLGRSRTTDVIDASIVLLASDGDSILTSDAEDLAVLAAAADIHVELIPV